MAKALVTGSAGLVGSESVKFLVNKGYEVIGIDNNMREYFFGSEASTMWNRKLLEKTLGLSYMHLDTDIRNNESIAKIFTSNDFEIIVHTAAQPSHDWAAKDPYTDFQINAVGTLVMLENYRKFCPKASFIFTSTNKVYGDSPNRLPLVELETRYELDEAHPFYVNGINESMSIDDTLHSVFGASKVAADILVQEYGKYFGLNTVVFRGGCLTGPYHSGTELHGFLSYLVKCVLSGRQYTILGYKGKQVRDNIHSHDLVAMFWEFHQKPRPGEIYNAGGSRTSNISILEAIQKIEQITGKKASINYSSTNRTGDHIWYISDVSKFKSHYPNWTINHNSDAILEELCGVMI